MAPDRYRSAALRRTAQHGWYPEVRDACATMAALPIDVVVSSPLTRALQTAQGLFDKHPRAPSIVVHPLLRERVENSCDVGRSPSALASDFPSLDVAHLDAIWWHAEGAPDPRGICVEPVESVAARALEFKDYLRSRLERCIAVVGHGTFFFHLTGRALANCQYATLELDSD